MLGLNILNIKSDLAWFKFLYLSIYLVSTPWEEYLSVKLFALFTICSAHPVHPVLDLQGLTCKPREYATIIQNLFHFINSRDVITRRGGGYIDDHI